jgi:hypothetical protein
MKSLMVSFCPAFALLFSTPSRGLVMYSMMVTVLVLLLFQPMPCSAQNVVALQPSEFMIDRQQGDCDGGSCSRIRISMLPNTLKNILSVSGKLRMRCTDLASVQWTSSMGLITTGAVIADKNAYLVDFVTIAEVPMSGRDSIWISLDFQTDVNFDTLWAELDGIVQVDILEGDNTCEVTNGLMPGCATVYPNPADDFVCIYAEKVSPPWDQILLIDMRGTILRSVDAWSQVTCMSLDGYATGRYILQCRHIGKLVKTFALIKR